MAGGQQMLLAGGFVPVLRIHASGSSTDTIPPGASNVVIELWAGGGTGFSAGPSQGGGGGGSSGYSRSSIALTPSNWGQTINYAVGASDTDSSVSSGTFSLTTMTAHKGVGGSATQTTGGAGGTAVGGTQANTTGTAGSNQVGGVGGIAGAGTSGTVGGDGSPYGAGGTGGDAPNAGGQSGQTGAVVFSYT